MHIPSPLSKSLNALDLYSPPASDIHPWTLALNWVDTIFRKYLVETNVASWEHKGVVQAIDVRSSTKVIIYLWWWHDSVGNDFKSEWINLNMHVACYWLEGKFLLGSLPIAQPGQIETSLGISTSGRFLMCLWACQSTSFKGWPNLQ